jgi:hypothetical protein
VVLLPLPPLLRRQPRVLQPPPVDVADGAVRQHRPDEQRHGVHQPLEAPLALALQHAPLPLPQRGLVLLKPLLLDMQRDEGVHLPAQHVRVEGLHHVVRRAHLVALHQVRLVAAVRGEEDDGRVARALPLADEARRLEAVQFRHLHVQQDEREVLPQQPAQRLRPGRRLHQPLAERLQDCLQGKQVGRMVIHHQDAGGDLLRHVRRAGAELSGAFQRLCLPSHDGPLAVISPRLDGSGPPRTGPGGGRGGKDCPDGTPTSCQRPGGRGYFRGPRQPAAVPGGGRALRRRKPPAGASAPAFPRCARC